LSINATTFAETFNGFLSYDSRMTKRFKQQDEIKCGSIIGVDETTHTPVAIQKQDHLSRSGIFRKQVPDKYLFWTQ
ncbi:MAG: hypothetical protein RR364_02510, partial [Lachnospiraceae bacterium]